jgi:hypothetical protein
MPDHLGDDMRKIKLDDKEKEEAEIKGKFLKIRKSVKSSYSKV